MSAQTELSIPSLPDSTDPAFVEKCDAALQDLRIAETTASRDLEEAVRCRFHKAAAVLRSDLFKIREKKTEIGIAREEREIVIATASASEWREKADAARPALDEARAAVEAAQVALKVAEDAVLFPQGRAELAESIADRAKRDLERLRPVILSAGSTMLTGMERSAEQELALIGRR